MERATGTRSRLSFARRLIPSLVLAIGLSVPAAASQAYGSLNNFDCVNDTGVEAHGFEIELDYGHTTDITYTYDYNHYGTPKVREDVSDPAHPKVFVRYESAKLSNGAWAAYTAVPSGPILPTQGHQFTNPAINFGGEHFGVGFMGTPAAVKYHWLVDDGTGNLAYGPDVYISTPTFTYVPPVAAQPAKVVAVVAPPPPVAPPVYQFGKATWVKEIKTVSHNPKKVPLKDLVGDDPAKPQPWANGEQPQVEVEWRILQTEFGVGKGGANGELAGAPEDLPKGDEMITRRYEFYQYVGPLDAETGQAMGDTVGKDGKHGSGTVTYADHFDPALGEWVTVTKDMSKIIVVGDFIGAQMAGFDVAPKLDLIDHLQDSDLAAPYPKRTVVISGGSPFTATVKVGTVPPGLKFDGTTGIISGTPSVIGTYTFTIEASDTTGALISRDYTIRVGMGAPVGTITTTALPLAGGKTVGGGTYNLGTSVTLNATVKTGYVFLNWSEAGTVVSNTPSYTLTVDGDHNLVANFAKICKITTSASPADYGTTSGDGTFKSGDTVTVTATPNAGYAFNTWTSGTATVSKSASYTFTVTSSKNLVANFVHAYNIDGSADDPAAGSVNGSGSFKEGATVKLKAVANVGYKFVNWTEAGVVLGTAKTLSVLVNGNHSIVAHFVKK